MSAQPHAVPVRIRGTVYPSQAAAARALGVRVSCIRGHLDRNGHADRVGLGNKGARSHSKGGPRIPLTIAGRTFPSRRAAARFLGISEHILRSDMKRGEARLQARLMAKEAGWEVLHGRRGPLPGKGGRPRSPASLEAERMLRDGASQSQAREATGLSRAQVNRIARKLEEAQ